MVLMRRHPSSTLNRAMMSASAGIIWTSRMATMKAFRPRNRKRETATAARNAIASASVTVSRVMMRLLRSDDQKKSRSNTLR